MATLTVLTILGILTAKVLSAPLTVPSSPVQPVPKLPNQGAAGAADDHLDSIVPDILARDISIIEDEPSDFEPLSQLRARSLGEEEHPGPGSATSPEYSFDSSSSPVQKRGLEYDAAEPTEEQQEAILEARGELGGAGRFPEKFGKVKRDVRKLDRVKPGAGKERFPGKNKCYGHHRRDLSEESNTDPSQQPALDGRGLGHGHGLGHGGGRIKGVKFGGDRKNGGIHHRDILTEDEQLDTQPLQARALSDDAMDTNIPNEEEASNKDLPQAASLEARGNKGGHGRGGGGYRPARYGHNKANNGNGYKNRAGSRTHGRLPKDSMGDTVHTSRGGYTHESTAHGPEIHHSSGHHSTSNN